eukprot:CAMPEP_0194277412 /NCGR_PEP_ID=MMETSP0169-20130528/9751_1 /TAXON_ID=218684 /ORGANISM="Corethron pennatum, Strain L29A3" /LENGTH=680 /DNA_ID=CAMNT_0039021383 /DNA_START=149 /DNA_END=2188 /DNA_ORIENTATION=+
MKHGQPPPSFPSSFYDGRGVSEPTRPPSRDVPYLASSFHQNQRRRGSGGPSQYACLYTPHVTRKRKIWHDGRLTVSTSGRATLHRAEISLTLSNDEVTVDACELTVEGRATALQCDGESVLKCSGHLVRVTGPWETPQQRAPPFLAGGRGTQSAGMRRVLSRKFVMPKRVVPPRPTSERELKRRAPPLQPGQLVDQYYGGDCEGGEHTNAPERLQHQYDSGYHDHSEWNRPQTSEPGAPRNQYQHQQQHQYQHSHHRREVGNGRAARKGAPVRHGTPNNELSLQQSERPDFENGTRTCPQPVVPEPARFNRPPAFCPATAPHPQQKLPNRDNKAPKDAPSMFRDEGYDPQEYYGEEEGNDASDNSEDCEPEQFHPQSLTDDCGASTVPRDRLSPRKDRAGGTMTRNGCDGLGWPGDSIRRETSVLPAKGDGGGTLAVRTNTELLALFGGIASVPVSGSMGRTAEGGSNDGRPKGDSMKIRNARQMDEPPIGKNAGYAEAGASGSESLHTNTNLVAPVPVTTAPVPAEDYRSISQVLDNSDSGQGASEAESFHTNTNLAAPVLATKAPVPAEDYLSISQVLHNSDGGQGASGAKSFRTNTNLTVPVPATTTPVPTESYRFISQVLGNSDGGQTVSKGKETESGPVEEPEKKNTDRLKGAGTARETRSYHFHLSLPSPSSGS